MQRKNVETLEKPECSPRYRAGSMGNMPKKATPARNGVQRTRSQKSFELVRPVSDVQAESTEEIVEDAVVETPPTNVALDALPTVPKKKARSTSISSVATEVAPVAAATEVDAPAVAVATKGNASARLAARKSTPRARSNASLITPEHYSYVRKDLAFIAVLATIMIVALIVLYFVPGIGA